MLQHSPPRCEALGGVDAKHRESRGGGATGLVAGRAWEGPAGGRMPDHPLPAPPAGEAGGFNAVQELLTTTSAISSCTERVTGIDHTVSLGTDSAAGALCQDC
jgi:hypothetical protein